MSIPFAAGSGHGPHHLHHRAPELIRHLYHLHVAARSGDVESHPSPPGFVPRAGLGDAGPGGFGPGGWIPGSGGGFPHGFHPGGPPWRGGHGRGGRGGRRGNVRAAVLALLAEEPRHGYSIMTELAVRSRGLWRPSPGSVYPVLQQLQDEGLVSVEEADGRRVFSLTDAGREHLAAQGDASREPWDVGGDAPAVRLDSLVNSVRSLNEAAAQIGRTADDGQVEKAVAALDTARKALYRILADDER
ncbi:MAG: hypothetical protein QG622_526 [Actinomycetota bacterium]|nr:hypothetical protein [Actinomycetota bacterium]